MNFPVELKAQSLELAEKLKVFPADIEEQFVRGSGAGGQKINKTANCVWLKHVPSGVEVKVQEHREREANRKTAYRNLILKIDEVKRGKESLRAQKIFKLRKQKKRRSKRAKEKMMESKRRRGDLKATRKKLDI